MNTSDIDTHFRIFLSRVSSEFDSAASVIASDLRARGLEVKIQEDFRQEENASTTLDKLHLYIRDGHAVIAILGNRSGAFPPDAAAQKYQHLLPAGIVRASYTQWEVHIARHYQKRLSFYDGRNFKGHSRAPSEDDNPNQQAGYIKWLFEDLGVDRNAFDTIDQLGRYVLREDWPLQKPHQPRNIPYPSLGRIFKGRDGFMDALQRTFGSGARVASLGTSPAITATYGLGGIGKTRLAVEYALRHAGQYDALLFLAGDTPEKLDNSFTALASLGVLNLPEQKLADPAAQRAAVLHWLHAHPRFFLIIDNLDDDKSIDAAQRLLSQLSGGDIVLTGRSNRWPNNVQSFELGVLSLVDATDFLLTATGHRRKDADDNAQARVIADKLGGLALALVQAAAYINEERATFTAYLGDWEKKHEKVLEWFDPLVCQYPKSVAVTWQTSWEKLSPAAIHLLELLAWFAPDPVPEHLLDHPATMSNTNRQVLTDLARYGLAIREADAPLFCIHRLVQDVIRHRLKKEDRAAKLQLKALLWVARAFNENPHDVSKWPEHDPLAPHVAALAETAVFFNFHEPAGHLYWFLSLWNYSHGRYANAIGEGRRAVNQLQSALGSDHPDTLASRSDLAEALRAQGEYAEAEVENHTVLATRYRVLGPEHPQTLNSRCNLAVLFQGQGKHGEAEAELRAVLPITERVLGSEHPDTLQARHNLTGVLLAQSKYAEAESELRDVLTIRQRVLGPEHPDTLQTRHNLAAALHRQNKSVEAEAELRAVLPITERVLGSEHPDVLACLYNMAVFLEELGKKAEALEFASRALVGLRKTVGEKYPHTQNAKRIVEELEKLQTNETKS